MKKKYKVKRKKKASASTVDSPSPMKSTLNVSADKVKGTDELKGKVDSKVKLEIEGKLIEERIDIYSKPQKRIFAVLIDTMKIL